ncbi:MAG: hypothetical protein ABR875_00075 [Minisyncoccia bacterium]
MSGFQSILTSFPFVSIILAIVIFGYWIYAFFIIYHLVRFGIGVRPKIFALIFFFGSMALFMLAISAFNQIDLSAVSLHFSGLNINSNIKWSPPSFNFPVPSI